MGFIENGSLSCSRRETVRLLLAGSLAVAGPDRGWAQGTPRAAPADAAHRIHVDVPILADDPVAVPLTVSVDHPMEPDHFVTRIDVTLASDPVPRKGSFRFTPRSGRASVAYQMRSGQGGELMLEAECTRHGRFETRQPVRVAPGGCAVAPDAVTRERGGSPSLRVDGRAKPGEPVAVWASLKHTSHTGLVEKKGAFVPERPPYFVERVTVFLGDDRVSEFALTPAVSPDPKLRFFVKAAPATVLRVVFVNNRGERWEVDQRLA
jgi:sulfur-oxidizing protein SoxY